ncbi:MAG: hypothetical protein KGL39_49870, partial [Patescibacteria group bacterium]|nr:hypothetical protein [Patescibacteria group bacterium]
MIFKYNGFDFSTIGEVTVKWKRDYEGGGSATGNEAPQRAKVAVSATVKVFERSYADNYALLRQAQAAVAVPNQQLTWTNEATGEDYIDQTATLTGQNFPEEWGTYFQQLDLEFFFYENLDTSGQNLPATFAQTGLAQPPLVFNHVTGWKESASVKRFSTLRSQREETRGQVRVEGWFYADPTLPLEQRRSALQLKVTAYRTQMNGKDGTLAFGVNGAVFNRVVRVTEFECNLGQEISRVAFAFTADYTLFPDEANYATVTATAEEKDGMTGETFLACTGKIQAPNETLARTKLAAVIVSFLAQYGYTGTSSQQLQLDTTPNLISANADGDTFTELTFSGQWRKWRSSNQRATFTKTGNKTPVSLGNVRTWDQDYRAERFDQQRSERRHATGVVSAAGTFSVDPATALADRRAALLKQQRAMTAEVNGADGALAYGDWSQTVRVESFEAKINQAETGIDWTLSASWSAFPNEGGYVTCE